MVDFFARLSSITRPALRDGQECALVVKIGMEGDWKANVILEKFREGCTLAEASRAAGITRQAVLKRVNASPSFREAIVQAREAGSSERRYSPLIPGRAGLLGRPTYRHRRESRMNWHKIRFLFSIPRVLP